MIFQRLFKNYMTKKQLKKKLEELETKIAKNNLNNLYGINQIELKSSVTKENIIPIRASIRIPQDYEPEGEYPYEEELIYLLGKEVLKYCEVQHLHYDEKTEVVAELKIVEPGSMYFVRKTCPRIGGDI